MDKVYDLLSFSQLIVINIIQDLYRKGDTTMTVQLNTEGLAGLCSCSLQFKIEVGDVVQKVIAVGGRDVQFLGGGGIGFVFPCFSGIT